MAPVLLDGEIFREKFRIGAPARASYASAAVEYNNSAAGISLARKYVHAQPDPYDEPASTFIGHRPPLGRLCKRELRVRDRSADGSFGGIQGAASRRGTESPGRCI
jgi:hypothetical protein